jgi:hypothetical protein
VKVVLRQKPRRFRTTRLYFDKSVDVMVSPRPQRDDRDTIGCALSGLMHCLNKLRAIRDTFRGQDQSASNSKLSLLTVCSSARSDAMYSALCCEQ